MSATTTRIPLAQARELAWQAMALLGSYCERIEVLGSIRRERPEVGDIELLAVPMLVPAMTADLFGQAVGERVNLLDVRVLELLRTAGILSTRLDKNARAALGPRQKRLSFEGFGLDLFSCLAPAQWGVLSVIRTGSNDFCHRLVAPCERNAYSPDGRDLGLGWMPARMFCKDGQLWRDGHPLETPDEQTLFEQLGQPYVPPPQREVR